jgi:hypothetical protein
MQTLLGVLMMIDGVLQAMGVAGLVSTIADRSWRDRSLFVAHLIVGAALVFCGKNLTNLTNPTNPTNRVCVSVLAVALILSLVEATWFNWTDAAIRAGYTAVACWVLLRKTTLPTT